MRIKTPSKSSINSRNSDDGMIRKKEDSPSGIVPSTWEDGQGTRKWKSTGTVVEREFN